jgi:hypothetical protein
MSNSTQQTSYMVQWLNDCTYILIPEASFFAKYPTAPHNASLTVRIISINSMGYIIETSSNFSPDVLRGEVIRMP